MDELAKDDSGASIPYLTPRPVVQSGPHRPVLAELALDVVRATDVEDLLGRLAAAVASVAGLPHVTAELDSAGLSRQPVTSPGPVRLTGPAAALRWRTVSPEGPDVGYLVEVPVLVDGRRWGAVYAAQDGPPDPGDPPDDVALSTLAAFAGVTLGHLDGLRRQRVAADREAAAATARERERMRTHILARVIDAQEAERARVARDLHDQIGQALTSVLLGLHLVDAAVTQDPVVPREAARQTAEVRELVADALRDVRRLAFELRPTLLDDVGLVAALDRLTTDLETRYRTLVEVTVQGLTDDVRLPPEVETVVYRVVQESLTNVVRHSGAARVSVLVEHKEGALRAVVADDGAGFDPAAVRASLGLRGMEERAALVGGALVLESEPGCGTTVTLEIPLG